jgi:hypothetical protein
MTARQYFELQVEKNSVLWDIFFKSFSSRRRVLSFNAVWIIIFYSLTYVVLWILF